MSEKKISLDEACKIGIDLHSKGKIDEAKKIYEKIIEAKPDHFIVLGNLGIIFSQLKKFDKAVEFFNKTIKINPNYAEAHNNLGNVLFEMEEFDKALDSYKKAVKLKPNFADAYNNLGNLYEKKGDLNKAKENFESSISIGIGLNKDKPYYNLGNIFRELGELQKSIDYYKKAIEINPNSIDTYINLSIALNNNGNLKEAIDCCEKAKNKDPNNIAILNNLGKYYQEIGNEDVSTTYYKQAIKLNPQNLRSRWLLLNTFPIIYKNSEQINFYKKNFAENLKTIEDLINQNNPFTKKQILNALSSSTNFYLHYIGENITSLQIRYGEVVTKLTKYTYPQFHKKIPLNKSSNFIKVGFISSFFYEGVVAKLFKNWIIKLDKKKFKSFVYHIGEKNDSITQLIKENCNNFFKGKKIDEVINTIISDKLDILIFLDIGMEPKMQIFGSLKLATFQCCAYGVPVTSGFKNIDYFLTGEIMETDSSEEHYSEKLIKLPALGVDYDIPKKINSQSSVYKKEQSKIIFLSLQNNYKLLPKHDHIYFEIIKQNPECKFWFMRAKNEFIGDKFKERISISCKKNNLQLDDFFVFYPQTTHQNYLDLINKSDVILDSLDWSGLNTSMEAINLNKPIITFPSSFMRSRHTFGILKILKIEELICGSKKEYVDLAVKLSKNSDFRGNIVKKIEENKIFLFNNIKAIKFLENFLTSLVNKN